MPTSAPAHAAVTDRQGRLTLTLIDDYTNNTLSTQTTTTLVPVSRLQTTDAQNDTKVTEVIEIGTNGIVGGVADLGEFKGKLTRQDVNSALLGLMTGKKFVSGTQTWNYYDLANAKFNYARLIADPTGAVYGAWVALDSILAGATFDTKVSGQATEDYDTMGPHLVYINGFPIAKARPVVSGDVTAGYVTLSTSTFFGSNEAPIPVLPPAAGQPPNALYASGRCFFLKVARVNSTTATVNSQTYAANSLIRYKENQPYKVVSASMGTVGAQTVTPTYIKADGTTVNYVGSELIVGASVIVDPGNANVETCTITAVSGATISFTTTKTHATSGIIIALAPTSGQCVYNPINTTLTLGDTLVAGDTIRLLFASYGSNSVPTTIGTSPTDTSSFAGVPGRLTPVSIAGYQIPRCTGSNIKVNIARKHVNGIGENEIIYGTAGVPDISYSLDVVATDNSLIMALQTGSTAPGAGGDVYSADYITRYMLANPGTFLVNIKSPLSNNTTVKSYTGSQPVFTTISESGASNSELTYKLSGKDFAGSLTITAFA
jgi:hypothetical protein